MHRSRQYGMAGLIMAALATACGGGGGEPERPVATSISISPAGPINVAAGTNQTLTATVLDQNGQPMSGQTITWSSSSGTVIVNPTGQTTTVTGTITSWGTVTATTATVASAPVTVSIVAGPAFALVKVNDLPNPIEAGGHAPIRVRVVDAFGNPVAGTLVTFSVTGGGGMLGVVGGVMENQVVVMSNAEGIAVTVWRTGTAVGANTATATAGIGTPIGFGATTIAGPPRFVRPTSPQVVVIDVGASFQPTWEASDQYGNPIPAPHFTFSTTGPAASVLANGQVTGMSPGQALVQAISPASGYGASILVIVATPNNPIVRTDLTSLLIDVGTTITVGIFVDMHSATSRLGSATLRIDWVPAQLTYVSDADGAAGVAATVNRSQAAEGVLRMSLASPNSTGWAGAVEVRRITFQVTSVVGRTGNVTITTSEIANTEFTILTPTTVSVSHPLTTR